MHEAVKSMLYVTDKRMTESQFTSIIRQYPEVEEVHVCAEFYDVIGTFIFGMSRFVEDHTILSFDPGLGRKFVRIRHHPNMESL